MRKLAKCTFQVVLLLGVAAMSVVACGDTTEPESVAPVVVTPAQLAYTVEPTTAAAGASVTPAVEVAIQDALGNLIGDATNAVTVAIGRNPNGGTLSGTTTVNAVSGVASFGDLSINRDGDDYTLAATAETLTSTTSTPFDITPCGAPAAAPTRTLCVVDPVGDHTGSIDVVRMVMNFDNVTGDYEIVLTADAANPFAGNFRININLFNPNASSFFQDAVNDFNLTVPTATMTLAGTNAALTAWDVGDQIFTNSLEGTPNPPGVSLFRSAVNNFPPGFLTNEDVIAYGKRALPAIVRLTR